MSLPPPFSVGHPCRMSLLEPGKRWSLKGDVLRVLLLLVFLFIAMGAATTGLVMLNLLIVLFYIPTAGAWIVKNKPRKSPPGEVPDGILPASP
jgi:hypothetical protein